MRAETGANAHTSPVEGLEGAFEGRNYTDVIHRVLRAHRGEVC